MEKKVLWAIIGILALFVVFGFGVLLGGGAVYLWTQPKPLRLEAVVKPNLPMEQEDGVLIRSVITGSPADKAGLVRGDIILKINGEQVNAFRELQNELGQMQPGDKVSLTVYHGDDAQTVKVTLGERNGQAYLGVLPCSVQPMGAIDQGLPGKGGLGGMGWLESGALVLKVEEGSPAQEAGLQVGDLIVRVNQEQINAEQNLGELLSRYKPGDEITLEIQRPGEEDKVQVEVKLGENLKKPKIPYLGIHYRLIGIQGRNIPQYPMIPYNGKEMPFDWFHLPQNGIQQGIVVGKVIEGSAAEQAGLQMGDVINLVDGETIEDPQAFADLIASKLPGDEIRLTVFRQGEKEPLEIKAMLDENPDQPGKAFLGIEVSGFISINKRVTPNKNGIEKYFHFLLPNGDEDGEFPHGLNGDA